MEHNLTGMARVGEGMLRAAPLQHIPSLLTTLGVKPEKVLRAAGLPSGALSRPENIVPVSKAISLITACAAFTGRPHFGLLAGRGVVLAQYGLVGMRMMHAPTVGAALRGLVLSLHLNGRAMVPAISIRDRVAALSFSLYDDAIEGSFHATDFTLASACAAMRALCGPRWAPAEVLVAHRAPVDVRPYRRFFKAPLRFGTNRSALLFSAAWLDRSVIGASPALRKSVELAVEDMLRQQDLELTVRVRRVLYSQFTQDDVSIEGVAGMLRLHKRTLNRRLAQQGTSFAKILGEVRFQIARQLLVETDLPFTEVAATLSYTDVSAFSRAFRSWAGMAPSVWRQAHAP